MPDEIGREFMEKTRHLHLGPSDQQRGLPPPPVVDSFDPGPDGVPLPPPEQATAGPVDFLALISRRTSVRRYADRPLSLADLSLLLWCTQGIKQVEPGLATLRTVPSAGARHAFETRLWLNRAESLPPGLYAYDALEHRLVPSEATAGMGRELVMACYGQQFLAGCAAIFFWIAVPYRMTWRYGQRGYRYLHLDAGHVGQNFYLAAESIGCGACAVAAFDDVQLNRLLGLDGQDRFVIYLAAVGKRTGDA